MPRDPDEYPAQATYVQSTRMPDGSYGVTVSVGPANWTLGPGAAVRYAVGMITASVAAEHDAAILALFRSIGMPEEGIGQVVYDARAARADNGKATRPVHVEPGVSLFTGAPFLHLRPERGEGWQWSPAATRHHAMAVLTTLAAADLDSTLREVLLGTGLDEARASRVIHELGGHWPAEEEGPHGSA